MRSGEHLSDGQSSEPVATKEAPHVMFETERKLLLTMRKTDVRGSAIPPVSALLDTLEGKTAILLATNAGESEETRIENSVNRLHAYLMHFFYYHFDKLSAPIRKALATMILALEDAWTDKIAPENRWFVLYDINAPPVIVPKNTDSSKAKAWVFGGIVSLGLNYFASDFISWITIGVSKSVSAIVAPVFVPLVSFLVPCLVLALTVLLPVAIIFAMRTGIDRYQHPRVDEDAERKAQYTARLMEARKKTRTLYRAGNDSVPTPASPRQMPATLTQTLPTEHHAAASDSDAAESKTPLLSPSTIDTSASPSLRGFTIFARKKLMPEEIADEVAKALAKERKAEAINPDNEATSPSPTNSLP